MNIMNFFLVIVIISLASIKDTHEIPQNGYRVANVLTLANNNRNTLAIRNTWKSFHDFVTKIKEKLKLFSETIKNKIQVLTHNFENKIIIIKNKIQSIIKEVKITGAEIKECLQGDKDLIEAIIKDILNNVTTCLQSHMNNINKIQDSHILIGSDGEKTHNVMPNKLFSTPCSDTEVNCLGDVNNEIIDEYKWVVSQRALNSTSKMYDSLDSVAQCFTEGLLKASAVIADETIKIVQCVKDHKG